MHRTGIFRSSALVVFVNYAGVPLLVVYFVAMFAFPWVDGKGTWVDVQSVWDRWQTLNAGALAFMASLVAFNISRFNENRQREREFVAAKAFLPSTLSGLMEYFSRSALVYSRLWESSGRTPSPLNRPDLPSGYREVFSNCIRHADPEVGSYLSNILVCLQVHDARLRAGVSQSQNAQTRSVDGHTLIAYLYSLGQLYALVSKFFGFARDEELFQGTSLSWDDFRTAYRVMGLEIEDIFINEQMNLRAFTERAISRS